MEGPQTAKWLSRLALELGVAVLLAVIFAFLGVYDSDAMPWGFRFLFWFILMSAGALALSMAEPLVTRRLLPGRPVTLQIALISLQITIPLTLGLVGLNTNLSWKYSLSNWALQFLAVFIIAIVIVMGRQIIRAWISSISNGPVETDPDPASAFRERLSLKYRDAEIWAVSSEGHYLRVHTAKGETLILLRLSDAMKELQEVDGLQTHRSWWVARAGVETLRTTDGKTVITLKSGTTVPVSRPRVKTLKAAGWS